MAVYLPVSVLVCIIAWFMRPAVRETSYGITRQQAYNLAGAAAILVTLFLVAALRINVGNDYAKYVEFMHLVDSRQYVVTEPGFNLLTLFVYRLCGFENYLLVFAVIAFFTVFFFLKGMWELSDDFALTFFFFVTLCYYLQSLSTVRYYLALALALYSIRFVLEGDWPRFVLIALVGASFHKSMLVILLLYPLMKMRWNRWWYALFAAGSISCLFFSDLYLKIAVFLYPSYRNTEYLSGGFSLVSIVRCAAVTGLALFLQYQEIVQSEKKLPETETISGGLLRLRFYYHANLTALALHVFASFLPVLSRITYYLSVTQILFLPYLLLRMKGETTDLRSPRGRMTACVAAAAILYFAVYLSRAGQDGVRILPYQTFLFHEMPPTLSETGYGT